MIPTPVEMQELESRAFARGVSAEALMDVAGRGIARVVQQFFPVPGRVVVFCGKGHNAGDVLVAARCLIDAGWHATIEAAFPESELAPMTAKKLAEFRAATTHSTDIGTGPLVVLDGLLGIGSRGEPRGAVADAIRRIQDLRTNGHAFVFAADLPSGLDAATGVPTACTVQADCTVTIGFAKSGLVADTATNLVGRLEIIALPELDATGVADDAAVLTAALLRRVFPPRDFDSHKGTWGRIGVIAGSPGFPGAARLCSAAAVAGGAGLVTLYVPEDSASIFSVACAPEVMIRPVRSYLEVMNERLDALAIGPGLGANHDTEVDEIFRKIPVSCVIDADALNALARRPGALIGSAAGPRLLTPHPVEMDRLVPGTLHQDRRSVAVAFAAANPGCALLLKGARTILAQHERPVWYNSTGNPGMGSGGMGDVLTGVAAALLGRGLPPMDAGAIAAWVCGRAAEDFVFGSGGSPEALTAAHVIGHLGAGFRAIGRE